MDPGSSCACLRRLRHGDFGGRCRCRKAHADRPSVPRSGEHPANGVRHGLESQKSRQNLHRSRHPERHQRCVCARHRDRHSDHRHRHWRADSEPHSPAFTKPDTIANHIADSRTYARMCRREVPHIEAWWLRYLSGRLLLQHDERARVQALHARTVFCESFVKLLGLPHRPLQHRRAQEE